MSHAANNTSRSASDIKVDSLVAGLSFMLVVNLMQRGIGFARNLSLCHFLSEGNAWCVGNGSFVFGFLRHRWLSLACLAL